MSKPMTVADLIRVLQGYDHSLPVDTVGAAADSYAWVEPATIEDVTLRHGGTRLGILGNSHRAGWDDECDGGACKCARCTAAGATAP